MNYFVVSFIFFSWAASGADIKSIKIDDNLYPLIELIESFDGEINLDQSIACNDNFKELEVSACTPSQTETFLKDYEVAHFYINRLLAEIDEQAVKLISENGDSKTVQKLESISQTALCVEGKLSKLTVTCRKNKICEEATAYVNHTFKTFQNFFDTVSLCNNYFEANSDKHRPAIIIHEVSHLCGMTDHVYFSWSSYHNKVPSKKIKTLTRRHPKTRRKLKRKIYIDLSTTNADHFEYWSKNGFCIPSVNC
jgi:hypothetical protein